MFISVIHKFNFSKIEIEIKLTFRFIWYLLRKSHNIPISIYASA